jgi:HEPN domain-containing protein
MHPSVRSVAQLPPFGRILSTPAGRFRLEASRCLSAAQTLEKHHHKNETPHYIILFHAIELGLKAFLIKSGIEPKKLRDRPYGHSLSNLYKEAIRRGLSLEFPNAGSLVNWIKEWEGAKIRYEFDTVRDLPTCAELAPLAEAIIEKSLPKGPQGQKRPADIVANVTRVAKILTGEVEEDIGDSGKDKGAQALGRKGGAARRDKLTPERRAAIARMAAAKRWHK